MNYNFDKLTERRGSNSVKWDECNDPETIPAWVADMDFEAAPCIMEALQKRVDHRIFGYTFVPDSYYKAITDWFSRKHDWDICRDWITYTSGVVPALSVSIKALTQPGDKVLIQTPVYDCFFSSIRNNGCEIESNPLRRTADTYKMDFDALERCAADPRAKVMLLCNPHTPAGRVWTPDELTRLGNICLRNGVTVVADEIHCELVYQGFKYTPFASVSDECAQISLTCVSASKAFSIAGLQSAAVIVKNLRLKNIAERGLNSDEIAEPNCFAAIAATAAFNEGEEWLDALNDYIAANKKFARAYIAENIGCVKTFEQPATYLMWLDCSDFCSDSTELCEFLRKTTGLVLSPGDKYRGNGSLFLRMNVACPRDKLLDGLNRLSLGVKEFIVKIKA